MGSVCSFPCYARLSVVSITDELPETVTIPTSFIPRNIEAQITEHETRELIIANDVIEMENDRFVFVCGVMQREHMYVQDGTGRFWLLPHDCDMAVKKHCTLTDTREHVMGEFQDTHICSSDCSDRPTPLNDFQAVPSLSSVAPEHLYQAFVPAMPTYDKLVASTSEYELSGLRGSPAIKSRGPVAQDVNSESSSDEAGALADAAASAEGSINVNASVLTPGKRRRES